MCDASFGWVVGDAQCTRNDDGTVKMGNVMPMGTIRAVTSAASNKGATSEIPQRLCRWFFVEGRVGLFHCLLGGVCLHGASPLPKKNTGLTSHSGVGI